MLVWLESKHGAGNKDGDGEGNVKDAVAITQIISFVLLFGPSSCLRIYCYYKTLTWDRKALWVYAKNFAYACVTAGCFIWSAWIVKGLSNMSMLGDSKSSLVWIESSRDLPISKSKWYDLDQVMAIVAAALAVILAWRKKVLTMLTESIRIRKIVYCIRKRLWLGREGMLEELPASEMVELEAQSQTLELASYPRERHEHSLQVELPAIVPFYELE